MDKYLLVSLSFILFLLQGAVFPFLFNGVYQPDIWLVTIVVSAMIFPMRTVISLAVIGGLIQDLVISNFFGLHLFPYVMIAYGMVRWGQDRYNRHWYVSVLSVMIGSVIYLILSGLVLLSGGTSISFLKYPIYMGVPFILYNMLFSVFLHDILWRLTVERESRW